MSVRVEVSGPVTTVVLDRDSDVAHDSTELRRQPVERFGDHLVETLLPNLDHEPIVQLT